MSRDHKAVMLLCAVFKLLSTGAYNGDKFRSPLLRSDNSGDEEHYAFIGSKLTADAAAGFMVMGLCCRVSKWQHRVRSSSVTVAMGLY